MWVLSFQPCLCEVYIDYKYHKNPYIFIPQIDFVFEHDKCRASLKLSLQVNFREENVKRKKSYKKIF